MPLAKPQMVNNLGSSFFNTPTQTQGFNPQQAGSNAIPQIGSAIASGVGTALKGAFSSAPLGSALNSAPSSTPQSSFSIANPVNPNANWNNNVGIAGTSGASAPNFASTPTGGITFPQTVASATSAPAHTASVQQAQPQSLADYIQHTTSLPGGGSVTGTSQGVNNYTPSQSYSIDTSGSVPSSALTSTNTMGTLGQSYNKYQDLVNGLSQAQGYSPDYIAAQNAQYAAQTQGAQLGLNSAALNSNLYTGNNLPGDTMNYAQGATAKAQAQNTLQQAEQGIAQLSANQALNTQQLARTGNIAAAQTQLSSSPAGMAGQNAINQYNTLQQSYPGANIPEYNTALSPEQNQQIANYIVSNSPAYKAGFQSTYQTPGGGTGIYSKLDVGSGGLQQNQGGGYTLVPAAAAALGTANANIVNSSLSNLSTINAAIDSSKKTLDTTTQFMNQNGLNQSDTPILTQIQNKFKDQTTQRGYIAGLNADLNTLRSDYSQFLIGRGGSIAGTGPNSPEVMQAIPDNISPAQLKTLVGQMQQDGQNTADAVSNQVNQALKGISSGQAPQQSQQTQGTTGSGSVWDF